MRLPLLLTTVALAAALSACSGLPTPPQEPTRYDLGATVVPAATNAPAQPAAIVLADIQAPWQAEGSTTAMHYRLAYAQPHTLYAYSQASWSLPPELLVQERLRQWLGLFGRVVLSAEGGRIPPTVQGQAAPVLQLALEDFHQVFDSADTSHALVRLRATVHSYHAGGDSLRGQQVFTVQVPTPTADAPGGAQALAVAIDRIGTQLNDWLTQLP